MSQIPIRKSVKKPLSCLLTAAIGAMIVLPIKAQSTPYPVACQATVPLNSGGTLVYRVAGSVPVASGAEVPQNPIGTSLSLTVQRENRNGSVQTWLNASPLSDYAEIAPDADYSALPFEGVFRAQPNNADRLYAAPASVNGLYVSLRPIDGQPQQIQVVHYLGRGQFVRSNVGICQPAPTS